ncbi:MAG TPA: peptidoglycan DD-metalloendopeptidase family protein [Pyrinomonadaceae bacterium]|jgi:murein DD-endopeptidase MepM/ murein hydrolase activator NlpD|nr:peptidoglycan DD-metalloendopeptidase family protein [Pyrinomonadaceae bacterium]
MTRDDRFYAFIVARTSRSRAHIRRISVHKRWLKVSISALAVIVAGLVYGFYGLTQQAAHLRIERENARLREQNEKQQQELQNLNNRVNAVEDTSRKLAEMSGISAPPEQLAPRGQGGPARPVDSAAALAALESKTAKLERQMWIYQDMVRGHGAIPSLWPVVGALESGVGGRRNPFGGRGWEYHEGQDIDAAYGTPVQAAANGRVTIAGRQRGYGNVVYIEHGAGLSTRYGHLSQINVAVGQTVTRGQTIGLVGSTGRSTGPHLHYEVRIDNQPVDPRRYLPGAIE